MNAPATRIPMQARLEARTATLQEPALLAEGRLRRMVGLTVEAVGCEAAIGAHCTITSSGSPPVEAEVVGFADDRIFLMPTSGTHGILPGARVTPRRGAHRVPVGDALLGRVLDGSGRPIDGAGEMRTAGHRPLIAQPINPLERAPIREPLDVGVRAINALLRVGRGQRLGLFAGSGVGKSTLLGMMTRHTRADAVVVALIGERGREVREFVHETLGVEGMRKAVVVATPADNSPVARLQGALLATGIAEHFRDQGRHVLLLMDSLTRFAQAQREIGLAVGEPPATKGYPPSVFAKLPSLVERAGTGADGSGSITAFYTVLTEGDDQQDPIADASRAILDGHLVLSREIAEGGRNPAIDLEASVSRLLPKLADPVERALIGRFRKLTGVYQRNRDLISLGMYRTGNDPDIDEAIARRAAMEAFMEQGLEDPVSLEHSREQLRALFGERPS